MKFRGLIASALALALISAPVHAQETRGTTPLSGAKGGTNNAFMQFTGPAGSLKSFAVPNVSGTLAMLSQIQTWTGAQSFTDGTLILLGATSGSSTIKAPATGGGVATLFPGTDTIAGLAAAQALTNKTFNCANNTCTIQTTALTGTLQAAQEPAHTNDCTNTAGSLSLTCLSTNGVAFTTTATAAAGQLPATATNDNAASGKVGEYAETILAVGSAAALTSATSKDIITLTLGAGDWEIDAVINFVTASTTSVTGTLASISQTLNTLDSTAGRMTGGFFGAIVPTAGTNFGVPVPSLRFSLSGSTTFHLVAQGTFTVSTMTAYGIIRARRAR